MFRLARMIVTLTALQWTRSALQQSLRHARHTAPQKEETRNLHDDKELKRKMLLASTLHTLLGVFYND
ncbi:MAG: hypothetical protein JST90_16745 [Bacteroidetes bacterium]|nr:hypothetical protein [Bacteroidota bacterium]